MTTEEKYELFDSYLDHTLDTEDKIAFEENLMSDIALKEDFEAYKETFLFLKYKHSNKTEAIKQTLQQMNKEHLTPEKVVKVFSLNSKWLSIAALLVLSLFGAYFYNHFNPNPEDYYTFETIHLTQRSNTNTELKSAETYYNSKKFKEAIAIFERQNFQTMGYETMLAYGYSLIETKNYKKANEVLNIVAQSNTVYSDKANWYLSLNELKQNKPIEARTYLLKISDESNEYEKATDLIERLD